MHSKKVMLSAIQPSNNLTLGVYLGALKNWVKLQAEYHCYFFAVDLHAITVRQDPVELRDRTLRAIATYIAAGIDPERCALFVQSHVSEHAELGWVITCNSTMGELSRMTQFKDKSSAAGTNIPSGLFIYPTLMAADILLYGTHLVPVGADQKQHLELTRDIAIRMNNHYGPQKSGQPLFVVPEGYHPPVGARIMSLQNPSAKMSKSDPDPNGAVYLSDTNDQIVKKVKRAVTDSGTEIAYDDAKPGVQNLLTIQAAITGKSIDELVASYAGKMYGHLKVDTADIVAQAVGPIRDKVDELMKDRAYLDGVLARGAAKARERARVTLAAVYDTVGFVPRAW